MARSLSGTLVGTQLGSEVTEVLVTSLIRSLCSVGEPRRQPGNTPLHRAAYRGRGAVAERLIAAGAAEDAVNKNGRETHEPQLLGEV